MAERLLESASMASGTPTVRERTREYYRLFPDYPLCRTVAENVRDQVLTHPQALHQLARKAEAERENREAIREKLAHRSVIDRGRRLRLAELSLRRVLRLEDEAFQEAVEFYFQNPYAHRRTWRGRWAPRWVRSLFLRVLFGHARGRGLQLDYDEYFEILRLL